VFLIIVHMRMTSYFNSRKAWKADASFITMYHFVSPSPFYHRVSLRITMYHQHYVSPSPCITLFHRISASPLYHHISLCINVYHHHHCITVYHHVSPCIRNSNRNMQSLQFLFTTLPIIPFSLTSNINSDWLTSSRASV